MPIQQNQQGNQQYIKPSNDEPTTCELETNQTNHNFNERINQVFRDTKHFQSLKQVFHEWNGALQDNQDKEKAKANVLDKLNDSIQKTLPGRRFEINNFNNFKEFRDQQQHIKQELNKYFTKDHKICDAFNEAGKVMAQIGGCVGMCVGFVAGFAGSIAVTVMSIIACQELIAFFIMLVGGPAVVAGGTVVGGVLGALPGVAIYCISDLFRGGFKLVESLRQTFSMNPMEREAYSLLYNIVSITNLIYDMSKNCDQPQPKNEQLPNDQDEHEDDSNLSQFPSISDNKYWLINKQSVQSTNNLQIADLRESQNPDLSGIDLSKANLAGGNFTNADLSEANLQHANMQNAVLVDADLTGADLTECDLTGADLTRANLQQASIQGAIFNNEQPNNASLDEHHSYEQVQNARNLDGSSFHL